MTEVSGIFFLFFYSLGLASPSQKSSPPTMSSDRQFEKWLEGPPSTDQVRSRLDDYTTKIQDIARVALDPDSAPFAEAKVKRVRANSNLIQQHLRRTEILAEWLLENIDEAADITPSRQTAETYLEYVSALDLYHRAEEIQEELVAELQTQPSESWISLFRHSARRRLKREKKPKSWKKLKSWRNKREKMPSKCNWNLSELQLLLTLTLAAPQLSALPPGQGISLWPARSSWKSPSSTGTPSIGFSSGETLKNSLLPTSPSPT